MKGISPIPDRDGYKFYGWLLFVFVLAMTTVHGQVERIEPPNWWVGFEDNRLQLLLKGQDLGTFEVALDHPQVQLQGVHKADSPNYLFLDLYIPPATPPGRMEIHLKREGRKAIRFAYELKERLHDKAYYKGFSSEDVIYLITPDRFANGDPSNDRVAGLREDRIDRKDDYARHGGDIRGIINHLDYIDDMGFTALWSSPLLENDMPEQSYHGYAITDFYRVDPRFGTLEVYKELASKARQKGIKLIMDQVANHCGLHHWWMEDLPFSDWINEQPVFERKGRVKVSNHRRTTNQDIYASDRDREDMSNGWFVSAMPDLNQKNPFMASYITQNSIWWIETLELGGIRQDTYPYPDKDFMASWAKRIMTEYPDFSIVGEEWSYNPLLVGYWQQGAENRDGYTSYLRSAMDFPLQQALVDALTETEDWDSGWITLYEALANDFHYASPHELLMFADNHDMDRIYTQLEEDAVLTKMAMAFVLLSPRIPQVYYGTEILMENTQQPDSHGLIRSDFPGGWEGDTVDAFSGAGLSEASSDMQEFLRKILHFRKGEPVIHMGKTKHFAPEDGIYVLFRYSENRTVALIMNKNEKPVQLELSRFSEMGLDGKRMYDPIKGGEMVWENQIPLETKGVLLLTNYK